MKSMPVILCTLFAMSWTNVQATNTIAVETDNSVKIITAYTSSHHLRLLAVPQPLNEGTITLEALLPSKAYIGTADIDGAKVYIPNGAGYDVYQATEIAETASWNYQPLLGSETDPMTNLALASGSPFWLELATENAAKLSYMVGKGVPTDGTITSINAGYNLVGFSYAVTDLQAKLNTRLTPNAKEYVVLIPEALTTDYKEYRITVKQGSADAGNTYTWRTKSVAQSNGFGTFEDVTAPIALEEGRAIWIHVPATAL